MADTDLKTRKTEHLGEEDCVDLVRGQVADPERGALTRHLDGECRRCTSAVRLWEAVHHVAAQETSYRPPEAVLRQARAAFSVHKPQGLLERVAGGVALVFDSFRQPLAAGVRAASAGPRQLLYKAGRYTIRLRLEPAEDSDRTFVIGQVLDELDPPGPLQDIAVLALKGNRTLDRTLTNQMGEFLLEPASGGDLQLCFGVAEIGTFTVVPGGDAGGEGPGGARGASNGRGRVSGRGRAMRPRR